MVTAFHSGDLGDIVYGIPVMQAVGVERCYIQSRHGTKEMTKERFEMIQPVLESVGIEAVHEDGPKPDYDFSTFRRGGTPFGVNITNVQARWILKRYLPYKPWLSAEPDPRTSGRILLHRSPRYRNPHFNWAEVAAACGKKALSICPEGEHGELEEAAKRKIERVIVKNFVHMMGLMAGADMFIGNQSSPMAIAIALGVKGAQETCLWIPDCVFDGNIYHSTCGEIPALGVNGDGPVLDKSVTPPGNWKHPKGSAISLRQAVRDSGLSEATILRTNTERVAREKPEWFGSTFGRGASNPYVVKNLVDKACKGGSIVQ